jgi:hypothetical protein
LTNGFGGCIHCAMNANEISPKADARLNRIKTISRVLKVLLLPFLLCLVGSGYLKPFAHRTPDGYVWLVWGTYSTFSDAPLVAKMVAVLAAGVFLAAGITCYQLLNLYEKGIIFSARNVQLLGRIGYLAFGYGLLNVWGPVPLMIWYAWMQSHSPLNSVLWKILESFSSPWIIGGLFVVVIARIMDEGRKIQEEQELTV